MTSTQKKKWLIAWKRIEAELPQLEAFRIPRWTCYSKKLRCELHGFSDISGAAYAAVVHSKCCMECKMAKVVTFLAMVCMERGDESGTVLAGFSCFGHGLIPRCLEPDSLGVRP